MILPSLRNSCQNADFSPLERKNRALSVFSSLNSNGHTVGSFLAVGFFAIAMSVCRQQDFPALIYAHLTAWGRAGPSAFFFFFFFCFSSLFFLSFFGVMCVI